MEQNTAEGGVGSRLSGNALLNSAITFAATLLIAWVLLKLLRLLKFVGETLREILLFWNIAFSSSQHSPRGPLRLHPYLCETNHLDEVAVNELYNFFREDVHVTHEVTVKDMHKVLSSYTHVLMCRDRVDGTLRGSILIGLERKGEYTLIKLGFTTFKNYYRGSPFIKLMTAYLTMIEQLKHPLTPIYVIGKVYGYKAYLHAVTMKESYPVYNRETPEHFKKIFADFAEPVVRSKGGRAKYNPETFVIEKEDNFLTENLTTLTKQDLQNPHIKFFVERNPGWKKGHCLVTGFRVSLMDYCTVAKRVIFRTQKKHPTTTKSPQRDGTGGKASKRSGRSARPKLLKRYTFQHMSANVYAVNNIEHDVTGEAVLSPTSKAVFAFQSESEDLDTDPTELDVDLPRLT